MVTVRNGSSTFSLHDAIPIWPGFVLARPPHQEIADLLGDPRPDQALPEHKQGADQDHVGIAQAREGLRRADHPREGQDRKSTRLNSSHVKISYAVFCLKKKTY